MLINFSKHFCSFVSCLDHELWQHSWLGDTVIYFMLRKCGFFSPLLYGNEIHWGAQYCSGRIPISQSRSGETNASTVADVTISCLTWQRGLETWQQNSVAFSYTNRMSFKVLNATYSENGLSFKWDTFQYAHESITTLSVLPLNQTPHANMRLEKNMWKSVI